MKYTRAERILLILFTHLLILIVGVFAIYYVQCRINLVSCDMAETAALDLQSAGTLRDPDQYLTYSVYCREDVDILPLRVYYGQHELPVKEYTDRFNRYVLEQKSFYALQIFPGSSELVSIAGHPAGGKGDPDAYIFVIRSLKYILTLLIGYVILSSVIYYLIIYSVVSQRRNRERIEQIYHQYIANISHELKSPIASMQAILEILNEGGADDEISRSRYYGILSRESRLLEHSVLQIIELSKLQDMEKGFEKDTVSTHDLLDPIAEMFASRCEEADIHFYVDPRVWELPPLNTNTHRLQQLLQILLDNAFKFVNDDGVIFIDCTYKHGQATLRVNDNGRGIPAADLPHIFERFFKTSVNNPSGTGLGLAIAQEIAAGLNERLWVKSVENEGTIFFITVSTEQ